MIVGTAGHVDHGKTALVRALTGIDTDRLQEEKTRGISIDLGFAYLPTPDGPILGFVDVPGHERFIRNMLAGATGIDFVLLVVAADDGVMPQTIEHLAIVDLLGVERGLVALTKTDLVSPERLSEAKREIANALSTTRIAAAEIVPVSAVTGAGIDRLRDELFVAARAFGRRAAAGRFRLAVDRSFTLAGTGTVVTGTVLSGSVAVGDPVLVSPSGIEAHVRSIHTQNRPAATGQAGDRCALNLAGRDIHKDAIARGDVVLDPALHAPTDRIDASLRLLPSEPKKLDAWSPVRLHHAAADVAARVVPLSEETIGPGMQGVVQLVLERPIAAVAGDRFVLRDTSGQRTLGGGRFLELRAPARKRRRPERLMQLAAHALADPQEALAALLRLPPGYVDLSAFARDRALSDGEVESVVAQTGALHVAHRGGAALFAPETWLRLTADLRAALEKFHAQNPALPGPGAEQLRLALEPRLLPDIFAAMLRRLAREEEVSLDGGWVRLATHSVAMTQADETLWQKIVPLIGGAARFHPPRVRDIARDLAVPEDDVRRVMQLAGRKGLAHEIARDHFLTRAAMVEIADAVGELAATAEGGGFSVAQLRDRLETSRKIALHILECFDRHGVTGRRGDFRLLNAARLDLFRTPAD
jgi:selenocysteine-specific elongation factor